MPKPMPSELLDPAPSDYEPSPEEALAAGWIVTWSGGDLVEADERDIAYIIHRAGIVARE